MIVFPNRVAINVEINVALNVKTADDLLVFKLNVDYGCAQLWPRDGDVEWGLRKVEGNGK